MPNDKVSPPVTDKPPVAPKKSFDEIFNYLRLNKDRDECSLILVNDMAKILAEPKEFYNKEKKAILRDALDIHFYSLQDSVAWEKYKRILQIKKYGVESIELALPESFYAGIRESKFLEQEQFARKFNSEKQIFKSKINPEFFVDITGIYGEYVQKPSGLAAWEECAKTPQFLPNFYFLAYREPNNTIFAITEYYAGKFPLAHPYLNFSFATVDMTNLKMGETSTLAAGGEMCLVVEKRPITGGFKIPITVLLVSISMIYRLILFCLPWLRKCPIGAKCKG